MKDSIAYDQYLQRIQVIDNVAANQEINRTLDVASWVDLQHVFRITIKSYEHDGPNEMHDHKLNEMFWRYFYNQQQKVINKRHPPLIKLHDSNPANDVPKLPPNNAFIHNKPYMLINPIKNSLINLTISIIGLCSNVKIIIIFTY